MDDTNQSAQNPDEINLGTDEAGMESTMEFNPVEKLLKEKSELEDRLLRTHAESENIRRRLRKEMDDARKYQNLDFARGVLPIVDNLTRAVGAAENNASMEQLLTGVKMVLKQFEDILSQYQITPIASVGQKFDPNIHEAISMQPSVDLEPNTVMQVVENGYQLHDRVIRPAKVIVSTPVAS